MANDGADVGLKKSYTKKEIVQMLETDFCSEDFYKLMSKANTMSRKAYGKKGYIFAQIGLNAAPCSGGCQFCSLGCDNFRFDSAFEMSEEEFIAVLEKMNFEKIAALFLMTTADYQQEKYLKFCKIAREIIPKEVILVANTGDFDFAYGEKLKGCGVGAVYHVVRLGEGKSTKLSPEIRKESLNSAKKAGLEIYYCVEPIGAEHSYEEIAEEILRAVSYDVEVMAVMARVPVQGTAFEAVPEISEPEITKIAAVTRIVCDPRKSMNVHEPKRMPLLAGVNQLYAEIGINPRDTEKDTAKNRGISVFEAEEMLSDAGYRIAEK